MSFQSNSQYQGNEEEEAITEQQRKDYGTKQSTSSFPTGVNLIVHLQI